MEPEKTPIAKVMLKKKTKAGSVTIPDFKLYYTAVIIKMVWYWHKNRHIEQWTRMENPEMNPHIYDQLIFNRAGKSIQRKKNQSLQQMVLGKWAAIFRRMNLDHFLIPYKK